MAITTIFVESFETDGNGTRYTASSAFNSGLNDHYNRTDGSNISNFSAPYSNVDGNFYWAAEDQDGGGDFLPTKTLTFEPIDTTGFTNLQFQGIFGVGIAGGIGSSAFDAEDFARVSYSIDGGQTFQDGLTFLAVSNNGDTFNEPFALDGNPANGFLSPTLQEFGFTLPEADSIILRIETHLNTQSEEFAFDNFRLLGEAPVQNATVELTATDPNASEEGTNSGTFTFTRTGGDLSTPLAVSYTIDGDASVTDYTPVLSGTVIIPANETSFDLSIIPVDDDLFEPTEEVFLRVIAGAGYDVGTQTTGTVAIADNDVPPPPSPVVRITPAVLSVEEGSSDSFTITRSGNIAEELLVTLAILPDTSLTLNEYTWGGNILVQTATEIILRIPAGEGSTTLDFIAEEDVFEESAETLRVTVADTNDYDVDSSANSVTATILPSAAIPPSASVTIVHQTNVSDGTDFDFVTDLNFLNLFTLDDANPDDGDGIINTIVVDNVAADSYTIQAVPEPGFILSRIVVDSTITGLGQSAGDVSTGTLTIDLVAGEEMTILFYSDQVVPAEDIDYAIAPTTLPIAEGDAGETPVGFTITRSGATTATSSVDFVLAGDALLGEDYRFDPSTGVTGTGITVEENAGIFTVIFAPEATEANLLLNVIGDTTIEPDETVVVQLQNGTAPNGTATITTPEAITTILNDDVPPPPAEQNIDYAITTATSSLIEGDGDRQMVSFTLTRTGATDVASQVDLGLGGSASLATDYAIGGITGAVLSGNTVEFAAGETTAVLTLEVLGDTTVEPDETIVATLSNGTAPDFATISTPSATTTILNDDAEEPTLPDAGPLLDLSDEMGNVNVVFQIAREAVFENAIQFYKIDNNQGTVAGLTPGDEGYTAAALSRIVPEVELIGTNRTTTSEEVVLEGGSYYAPVLFINGDRTRPLFAFDAANPGDRTQIISPSPNTFQFEDLVGGDDDFNDLIVEATIVGSEATDTTNGEFYDDLLEAATVFFDNLELSLSGLPDFLRDIVESSFGGIPELDELTGLVSEGVELIQQSGIDGILYFYTTDALGLVDGLPPTAPGYEDAVRNNFISEIALSDLFSDPLPPSIDLPDVPNYGVALTLNTDPSNLLTIQDAIFPNNSSTDVVIVEPR